MMTTVLENTAIVIVTYKRLELLEVLFESIQANTIWPGRIYVVDNDADEGVGALAAKLQESLPGTEIRWIPMDTNTGGAGGFSKGVDLAYHDGAEWIWLMDDDVKLLPDALEKLMPWMQKAEQKNV